MENSFDVVDHDERVEKEQALQDERDRFYADLMELQQRLEEETRITTERFQEEAANAEARHRQQAQRVIRRMLQQQLAAAYHTFVDRVADARGKRTILTRILLRMMKRTLSAGFCRFVESCDARRSQRMILSRIVIQWTKRALQQCFEMWLDVVADRAEEKHKETMHTVQNVIAREGHYEHKYNLMKTRFQQHGKWIIDKLSGMKLAQAFDLFHDKVSF